MNVRGMMSKQDLEGKMFVFKFLVLSSKSCWTIISLTFIVYYGVETPHTLDKVAFVMPEYITLLCVTILKILKICYTVLFSETPSKCLATIFTHFALNQANQINLHK